MTLKEMNKRAADIGETAESVFRHGLNSLLSSREALAADRKNPIKYQISRIVNDLHDISIAENILREWYGIRFCDIGTHKGLGGLGAQVYCGIDELAAALDKVPKETDGFGLRKDFEFDWCNFCQLPERGKAGYKRAFDGNPQNYSTTYEEAYGEGAGDDK